MCSRCLYRKYWRHPGLVTECVVACLKVMCVRLTVLMIRAERTSSCPPLAQQSLPAAGCFWLNVLPNAQAKADPAAADEEGWTPAFFAAQKGHAGVLRLLQEAMGRPWHAGSRGLSDDETSMVESRKTARR